jgi:hypothetical protein
MYLRRHPALYSDYRFIPVAAKSESHINYIHEECIQPIINKECDRKKPLEKRAPTNIFEIREFQTVDGERRQ